MGTTSTMSTSTVLAKVVNILDGFPKDHGQKVQHAAGLGIQIDDKGTVTTLGHGQCRHHGVEVGDTIVGLNGIPLRDCLKPLVNAKSIGAMLTITPKPFTLNFNEMPAELNETDQQFSKLMKQGIEVVKEHHNGSVFNRKGLRVMSLDENTKTIKVSHQKDDGGGCVPHAFTGKLISVHDVVNVGVSSKDPHKVTIQTKDPKQDVKLQMPSNNAGTQLAKKLFNHCKSLQDENETPHIMHASLSPKAYRNSVASP